MRHRHFDNKGQSDFFCLDKQQCASETQFRVNNITFQTSVGRTTCLTPSVSVRSSFCCGSQRRCSEAAGVKRSQLIIFKSCVKMCHKTLCLYLYIYRGMATRHYCLSPCQLDSLTAPRLTLSRPHNLSAAFSIWPRDDDQQSCSDPQV